MSLCWVILTLDQDPTRELKSDLCSILNRRVERCSRPSSITVYERTLSELRSTPAYADLLTLHTKANKLCGDDVRDACLTELNLMQYSSSLLGL